MVKKPDQRESLADKFKYKYFSQCNRVYSSP